jgi:GxxExxY protein
MTQIFYMLFYVAADGQTYDIIGAAFEVHKRLGSGFLEAVYQEAFLLNWRNVGFHFRARLRYPYFIRDKELQTGYRSDFICHSAIVVELKAISTLGDNEMVQVLNYLRATRFQKGLLFNFGAQSLEKRRLVM